MQRPRDPSPRLSADELPDYIDDEQRVHPGCFLEAVGWLIIVAYWIVVGLSWALVIVWLVAAGGVIAERLR